MDHTRFFLDMWLIRGSVIAVYPNLTPVTLCMKGGSKILYDLTWLRETNLSSK